MSILPLDLIVDLVPSSSQVCEDEEAYELQVRPGFSPSTLGKRAI